MCHQPTRFSNSLPLSDPTAGKDRWWVLVLLLLLLLLLATLAACAGVDPPRLPQIGVHVLHVGETWTHLLQPLPDATGTVPTLQWRLRTAPAGLTLTAMPPGARLTWVPDAFALAPGKRGMPRQAGPPHPVSVEATDEHGATVRSDGVLTVAPVPLPPGILAPEVLPLTLDGATTARTLVRTDATRRRGAQILLPSGGLSRTELLPMAPGLWTLRVRPDDDWIRRGDRHPIQLATAAGEFPAAQHTLALELHGRSHAVPCHLNPPLVQVSLPAQWPAGTPLPVPVTASDADAPVAFLALTSGLLSGAQTTTATAANDRGEATLQGTEIAPGLLEVRVTAGDLDDPYLGVCQGVGHWPPQGPALVGIGPGCTDDTAPASASLPLALTGTTALARRHCPQTADVVEVTTAAALGVVVATPPGWPAVAFHIHEKDALLCAGHSLGGPCWLPPAPAPRRMIVTLTAKAATSSWIRLLSLPTVCVLASPQPTGLPPPLPTAAQGLCPGESRLWRRQPSLQALAIRCEGGPFEVLRTAPPTLWRDQGGLVLLAPAPGAEVLQLTPERDQPLTCTFQQLPVPPGLRTDPHALAVADPLRLPGSLALVLAMPGPRHFAFGLDLLQAGTLTLQPFGPGPSLAAPLPWAGPELTDAAPLLPSLALPWTLVSQPPAGWTVTAGPGPGLLALTAVPQMGWLRVQATAATGQSCLHDRIDALGDGPKTPVLLRPAGPRALVLGNLRLCPGDDDWLAFDAPTDALVEVATLASVDAPRVTVTAAGDQTCLSLPDPPPPAPPGLQPGSRQTVTCWLRQGGRVRLQVAAAGTGTSPIHYDLAVRVR